MARRITRRNHRRLVTARVEFLEERTCLSSVGWDGPGLGAAELTYYIGDAPSYLDQTQVDAALERALTEWSDVVDVTFTETSIPNRNDSIDFSFGRIDGAGGTLAQAYLPDDVNPARIAGNVQFDISDRWEIGNRIASAFDLVLVAVHEIGHALGLEHSHAAGSVMAPSVSPTESYSGLSPHDVDAALAIYAPASEVVQGPTVPSGPSTDPNTTDPNTTTPNTTDPNTTEPAPRWSDPTESTPADPSDTPSTEVPFYWYSPFGRFGSFWFGHRIRFAQFGFRHTLPTWGEPYSASDHSGSSDGATFTWRSSWAGRWHHA